MWRAALVTLVVMLSACSHTREQGYTEFRRAGPSAYAEGDFDGDGLLDHAALLRGAHGNLVLLIRRAAGPDDPYETFLTNANRPSDLPYLQITTVPPGTYRTACDRYFDACRDRVPAETVILTDGLVMRVLSEPTARFLHYWDGAAFQNILIAE